MSAAAKVATPVVKLKTEIAPARLEGIILEILTAAPNQRAIDVVAALNKDHGVIVERSVVNKILYSSRFETADKQGAAPLWRVKEGVADAPTGPTPTISTTAVKLWIAPNAAGADKILRAMLEQLAELGESGITCDPSTTEGQLAAEIAGESGLDR